MAHPTPTLANAQQHGTALDRAYVDIIHANCPHQPVWQRFPVPVFGFIGNYWYTHYFYAVLRASYSMPSWRINGVPIAMFFATHFYFTTYHVLGGLVLRKLTSTFEAGAARDALYWYAVLAMSYTTALTKDGIWSRASRTLSSCSSSSTKMNFASQLLTM